MPGILRAINASSNDTLLDFGCGGRGYLTFELARRSKKAIGLDTHPPRDPFIPPELFEKLEFVVAEGDRTEFPDDSFDAVLMSEVLLCIPEPERFLREVERIVKPGGRVVIVNTVDRLGIREAYEKRMWLVRMMIKLGRAPSTYEEYTDRLHLRFGNAIKSLPNIEYYKSLIERSGLALKQKSYVWSSVVQKHLDMLQFMFFCLGMKPFGRHFFLFYPYFWILAKVLEWTRRERDAGSVILVGEVQ